MIDAVIYGSVLGLHCCFSPKLGVFEGRGGGAGRGGEGMVVRVGAGGGQVRRWYWVNVSGEAS